MNKNINDILGQINAPPSLVVSLTVAEMDALGCTELDLSLLFFNTLPGINHLLD